MAGTTESVAAESVATGMLRACIHRQQAEREQVWVSHGLLKSQSPPLVTHFLEDHTSYPPWTVLPIRNRTFKSMSLMGALLTWSSTLSVGGGEVVFKEETNNSDPSGELSGSRKELSNVLGILYWWVEVRAFLDKPQSPGTDTVNAWSFGRRTGCFSMRPTDLRPTKPLLGYCINSKTSHLHQLPWLSGEEKGRCDSSSPKLHLVDSKVLADTHFYNIMKTRSQPLHSQYRFSQNLIRLAFHDRHLTNVSGTSSISQTENKHEQAEWKLLRFKGSSVGGVNWTCWQKRKKKNMKYIQFFHPSPYILLWKDLPSVITPTTNQKPGISP